MFHLLSQNGTAFGNVHIYGISEYTYTYVYYIYIYSTYVVCVMVYYIYVYVYTYHMYYIIPYMSVYNGHAFLERILSRDDSWAGWQPSKYFWFYMPTHWQ